ncbi:uncharacterized protein C11orf16 homolog [Discoglossus pictus]
MLSTMISRHRMHHYMRPLCSDHRCCSVGSHLSAHSCHGLPSHPETLCGCSAMAHSCVAPLSISQRCLCTSHYPHISSVTCKKVDVQRAFPCLTTMRMYERVLARREPDGFYYPATVKQEEEPGMFLIEFDKPCAEGKRYQAMLQKTDISDIIEYFDALRHCIVPGDNVLAPWEADLARYGPGTVVMGLETRDPLRATEDEELTVSFWNGKKTTVPLGVAVWISPSAYKKVLDMLHLPISRRQKHLDRDQSTTRYVFTDRFTTAPRHTCTADHLYTQKWHHHVAHTHQTHQHCSCCCFPTYAKCTCCYDPKCQEWWPLSPRTTVHVQGRKDQEDRQKPNSILRRTESPKRAETSRFSSSYSSMSEEDDDSDNDESDNETYLSKSTQSTMVDSAVNTDSSLWEKPMLDISGRPEWKYWKRSHPEPHHRKPGSSISSNKFNNKTSESSVTFLDPVGPSNQSALFETILDSPVRRLTVKDVLAHKDFNPSYRQLGPPVVEHLGQSEMEKLRRKQAVMEQKLKQKIQHREWEQKREEYMDQKYSDHQEAHRKKTLNHLKNEELKVKEREIKKVQNIKAKKHAREINNLRMETLAAEDKQKEQRRLDHLRHVREKIDQKEFEICATNEQKEINNSETKRKRVDNHYRQVAEKVFEAEQKETRR